MLPSPLDLKTACPGPCVAVGFSGGLDSTVLLHLLAESGLPLRAVHVHHGLHAQADAWAEHCARVCDALTVPLHRIRVEVPRDSGEGLEAAARRQRHAALAATVLPEEAVALAHHLDDQAETFLLRALRGSGPAGLSAMSPCRRFGRGWLWRPLLAATRAELERFARARGLSWIDDPSNTDTTFDRNFLRQAVLPRLRTRWPHAAQALARSAELCAQETTLLDAEDRSALQTLTLERPHLLDRAGLAALTAARRARVLRLWVQALGLPPLPARGVAAMEHELLPARPDAQACFAWHGAELRVWRHLVHAGGRLPEWPPHQEWHWDGSAPLRLPDGGVLCWQGPPPPGGPWRVRARRGGERLRLPGRAHRHAVKHLLQEHGVPPWERGHLPMLYGPDGTLLAVGDALIGHELHERLSGGTRLRWSPPSRVVDRPAARHEPPFRD